MLLWIGAILCFFAYGILIATEEEPPKDNVSTCGLICVTDIHLVVLRQVKDMDAFIDMLSASLWICGKFSPLYDLCMAHLLTP